MQVNGKTFYHVLTFSQYSRKWKPGKTIVIDGSKHNQFIKLRLTEVSDIIKDVTKGEGELVENNVNALKEVQKYFKSRDKLDTFELFEKNEKLAANLFFKLDGANNVIRRYVNLSNEFLFELLRISKYKELPSRLRCFWLCDKKNIKRWLKEFTERDYKKVFEVKAYGEAFKVDRSWIQCKALTSNEWIERAEAYWKGEVNPKASKRLPEYLFIGKIEIIREIRIE